MDRAGWVDEGDDVWSYSDGYEVSLLGEVYRVSGGTWAATFTLTGADLGEFTGPDAMTRAMQAVEQAAKEA